MAWLNYNHKICNRQQNFRVFFFFCKIIFCADELKWHIYEAVIKSNYNLLEKVWDIYDKFDIMNASRDGQSRKNIYKQI